MSLSCRVACAVLILPCVSLANPPGAARARQSATPPATQAATSRTQPATALPTVATEPPPQVADDDRLAIQVRLDRAGFSPGEIDGRDGANTRKAVRAFQGARTLAPSGRADGETIAALASQGAPPLATYVLTEEDLAGPFVPAVPPDLMEQATLPTLAYTSVLEMLGERFHASPRLLERLNPGSSFTAAGESIVVPNVPPPPPESRGVPGVTVTVSKNESVLTVRSEDGTILLHAPVTTGSERDPLPLGIWNVTAVARNPPFHYNPDLFWDADPTHAKATIPPGPNNPVGVVWIDLTREHYGLHGTSEPKLIGRAESHGCVRMTNWDVLRVASMVAKGTPVRFIE
jgi:lipoprotein-anchoring transpeptidase ErfK/SrfK